MTKIVSPVKFGSLDEGIINLCHSKHANSKRVPIMLIGQNRSGIDFLFFLAPLKRPPTMPDCVVFLVDVGSQVLRDTFDRIHPSAGLHSVLTPGTPEHTRLQSLRSRRILNPTQWGKWNHLFICFICKL